MKLIANASTFSHDDRWTEFKIYKHGTRFRIQTQECGLGWVEEEPWRRWATSQEVDHLLSMPARDVGTVSYDV